MGHGCRALAHAKNGLGILDHHVAESALPITTPLLIQIVDDQSHYSYLAAVGVTFMTIVALNKELRDSGVYDNIGSRARLIPVPGSSCFRNCSRRCTFKGIIGFLSSRGKVLKMRHNVGLRELGDLRYRGKPNSYHLGFVLGPRINAGGRVGMPLGTKLLCTEEVTQLVT